MTTIEERAKEWAREFCDNPYLDTDQYESLYIEIANEQRKADLEEFSVTDADGNRVAPETLKNACEIVRNTTKYKMINKAFNWFVDSHILGTTFTSGDLHKFRKAMEEA